MIIIGADHAGYALKEKLVKALKEEVKDLSPKLIKGDDYPAISKKVARAVLKHKAKGILCCGSGEGVAIAANRIKGVRAVTVLDNYAAKMSRIDNDANVLCLRGRKFSNKKAIQLAKLWLRTPFSNAPRHKRRIKQVG
tara:strand:- start:40 stop:453 length:414 start_codon:yes stop_codon:yes gene_type:complete